MVEYRTPEDYQNLYNDKLDSELYPPSRAWDQIELNLHHDYLDTKTRLLREAELTSDQKFDLWEKLGQLTHMTRDARSARLAGEDPLHWRLAYTGKEDPSE